MKKNEKSRMKLRYLSWKTVNKASPFTEAGKRGAKSDSGVAAKSWRINYYIS